MENVVIDCNLVIRKYICFVYKMREMLEVIEFVIYCILFGKVIKFI